MEETLRPDISSFPKELHLVLAILEISNRPESAEKVVELINTGIDWDQFVHLVNFHRVYPSIRTNIRLLDTNLIPSQVILEIDRLCAVNTLQMLFLTAEMDRINKIFEDNQLRAILLKGPALAFTLYGDTAFRNSKDLDILVPLEDFERAEALLLQAGYILAGDGPRILNEWKIKRRNDAYLHPQKGIQIELHWRLYANLGKEPTFNELWERKSTQSFSSQPVHSLGQDDLFFYLAIHGAKHGWFRLRWLLDIDRLLYLGLDWEKASNLFKKYYCEHLAGQTFILSYRLFGSKLTEEMKHYMTLSHSQRLAQEAVTFINDPVLESTSKEFKRYWYNLLANRHKLAFVQRLLYPSFLDAITLPLPKSLHFLYFPLRPFLWIWRRMKQSLSQQA